MKGCLLFPFKVLVAIPQFLINGGKWCLENGIKGFIVFGVFVLIIAAIFGKMTSCGQKSPPAEISQPNTTTNMPSITQAPFYVQTDDKLYYVEKYHWQTGSLLIIQDYWFVKGDHWVNVDKALAVSGKPQVGKRK